ncbi:MAG: hypothetical protein FRX49_04111 [Trebouxia sp. A1-2]|nr:MAG: hypothetical protein FRX49_04111 [Trebouxia sp. A1-2]
MPPREKARHFRSSSRSDSRHPSPQLSVLALEEAETLQQRAERKRGREAVSAYEQAASRFRRALDLQQRSPLRFERHCDAYFGLAEVLQKWAEAVLAVCRTLPDADLTRDVEQQASNAAQPLFRQSVEAYQQVRTGMQEMRADAAVNSGNTLAAWAELLPAGAAVQMLASAQKAYEAALTQEEDAATWGNRADALVRQAELLAEVTPAQLGENAVGQSFAEALQAYEKACSMTSSEQGDDLPGLLHNWGVGLRSMADLQQDAEAACNMYALAVQKLQASIQFVRGDVAPHNAVGDAHVSWAERLPDSDAMQHLHLALDQGYQGALHISASCSEALLGVGEVHSKMGKLCLQNMPNDADLHFQESATAYKRALRFPETLGSFQDRGNKVSVYMT